MPRQALAEIYGKCGNNLHRGFLKHALKGEVRTYDVDELTSWHKSLVGLITQHLILFQQEQRVVLVTLIGGPDGNVMVVNAQADGPFEQLSPDTHFRIQSRPK
jgi:hypothetical protein